MTPEQIRAAKFETDSGAWECARWLQEIATQLAEISARQRARIDITERIASALEGLERR